MTFFNRWYIQRTVTKITSTQAVDLILSLDQGFPTVPDAPNKLASESGEIYHFNLKFPLSKVKELWGLPQGGTLSIDQYKNFLLTNTFTGVTLNYDTNEFEYPVEVTQPDGTFSAEAIWFDQYGEPYSGVGSGETEAAARAAADAALVSQLEGLKKGDTAATNLGQEFFDFVFEEIRFQFIEFEREKIAKVGQYLAGDDSIDLPGLDRKLIPGEGKILANNIFNDSEYVFTNNVYLQPGNSDASLVQFQVLLFIPKKPIFDTPIAQNGVTPLSLSEIRLIACSPKKSKKRKKKIDDPSASTNTKKGYLTPAERRRKELNRRQKQDIAERVRSRVLQVADSSFIRALANADKIKTTKDAFDFCLNVIPLRQMVSIALECASKYINESPEDIVCKTIMDNLESEDIQTILKYANINASTDSVAQYFKQYIVAEFDATAGSTLEQDPSGFYMQFRQFMVTQFQTNVTNRQIICAMIYAALPAAITLLALYIKEDTPRLSEDGTCADPLNPTEEKIKSLLENPAKDGLKSIKNSIYNHPIVGLYKNFADNFINQIIKFVDELIVQSVATILQELAYLCEDSDKSDLANALANAQAFDIGVEDILSSRQAYKDTSDFVDELVAESLEDFDGCDDLLSSNELIEEFFDDVPSVLTPSEVCILFNGDPLSLNYNIVVDKIFFGLLKISKYECLEKAIKTRNNFIVFIDTFGEYINEVACQNKIEEYTKNKKVISDLCQSSDEALVNDLSTKASEDLLDSILNTEQDLLNNLLGSVKNLVSPPIPELFCGPEAERTGKTPLLPTFQEESQLYLSKKFLTSVFTAAEKLFESEVDNFKVILTNPVKVNGVNGPDLDKFFSAASQIKNAIADVYGIELKDQDGNSLDTPKGESLKQILNELTDANKRVAPDLRSSLIGVQSNLVVDVFNDKVFQIRSVNDGFGVIRYIFNYSDEDFLITNLPPDFDDELSTISSGVSKLMYIPSPAPGEVETTAIVYQSNLPDDFSGLSTDLFSLGDDSINYNDTSQYLNVIKDKLYTTDFYATILEQIIREHAEFISSSDLFEKQRFDQLPLSKNNFCDISLFNYDDIIDKLEDRAKRVECYTGIGKIPTPSEKVQMASVYEVMVRTVTAMEIMKSFFVFASFGLEALVPTIDGDSGDQTFNSFYFNYLIEQITTKIDDFIPEDKKELLETAIEETVAADNKLKKPEVEYSVVIRDMIQNAIERLQKQIAGRLRDAGFKTKLGSQGTSGVLFDEATGGQLDNIDNTQELKNILKAQTFIDNVRPASFPVLPPPTIKALGVGNGLFEGIIEVEPLYSAVPELVNGGFFTERGLEMIHNRIGSSTQTSARSGLNPLTSEEIDQLIDALPLDLNLGEEYALISGDVPVIEYIVPFFPDLLSSVGTNGIPRSYIQLWEPSQSEIADYYVAVQDSIAIFVVFKTLKEEFEYKGVTGPSAAYNLYKDIVEEKNNYYSLPHPPWLQIVSPEQVEKINNFDKSGYNKGTGKPLGLNRKSILNILGRNMTSSNDPVVLQPGAKQDLDHIQKYLFGGQVLDNSGGIVSTIFSEDYPYGFRGGEPNQIDFFKRQGRIPQSEENIAMISDLLNDLVVFSKNLVNGIVQKFNKSDSNTPQNPQQILNSLYGIAAGTNFEQQLNYLQQRMVKLETYFYKLGSYETLNLLIRIDQTQLEGFQQILSQLKENVSLGSDTPEGIHNMSSFSNAVLERKFIIKDGDIFYFKLPLAYSFKKWTQSASLAENLKPPSVLKDGAGPLLSLLSSLQYDNILSFVSIFVTSSLQTSYPELNSMFNKTLLALQSSMLNQMAISDRVNDQSYYANDFNATQLAQFQQSQVNILPLFLEGILKAVANMTDPTWKTPWLSPGPLTPFGILAKLLSGDEDVGSPEIAEEANQVPSKQVYDCLDEQ